MCRTIAHPEIPRNNRWVAADHECYECKRWKYTIFILDARSVIGDKFFLDGTFEFLTTPDRPVVPLIDIRLFCKSIIQITGDEDEDFARYFSLLDYHT